ncbi:AraC family transcriptional regulator [Pseudonocardia spirodelae]|uniref:AraC family transcriptional regulator n=1 Tax=Pseudonocardia spirodelae TaxID=3133431 RepID=A0ABU8TCJ0_9PSEU
MDPFSDLLRGLRSYGAVFGSTTLTPPWSLRVPDGAPLTLCVLLRGRGRIVVPGAEPEPLRARDTAVVRGPGGFEVVDDPVGGAAPGGPAGGDTVLVTGAVTVAGEVGARLLDALPPVLRVPAPDPAPGGPSSGSGDPVLDHLAEELAVDAPGQQVVLDRLLDWLLVCTLRTWFDRPGGHPPSWWAARQDPVVGEALRLLHDDPAAPWTVARLAAAAGVSRATLAARFTERVGEPPLTYLTGWRMTLAAQLLASRPDVTLAEVARRVGYADAFGFSTAFTRVRGVTPSAFRRARVTTG